MKNIQNQWKKIGHISRKDSNKLWSEFRAACNHFFDRYHEQKNTGTAEENDALIQKEQLFEEVKSFKSTNDKEADLKVVKQWSKQWTAIGRVPKNKHSIDREFFKAISKQLEDIGVSEDELKALKYTNKIQELSKDPKALNNEISFVRKKIDEIKAEMNQLENNLQFFSNVADDNPVVLDVQKKIERHKTQLEQWTKKLSNIKRTIK
jgi:chromosome segregation ATPase